MYKLKKSNLKGFLDVPVSKSYLHRALILAALQEDNEETKIITNQNQYQDDVLSTIDFLRKLGSIIEIKDKYILVKKSKLENDNLDIFVNESGTTLRFLIPLLCSLNKKAVIKGKGRVLKRPLGPLKETLEKAGSIIDIYEDKIIIDGKIEEGKTYEIDSSLSSQYISGLLISLTRLKNVKITLKNKIASSNYITLTKEILKEFGYFVKGKKNLEVEKVNKAKSVVISESDWSSAVSLFGLSLSGKIKINNLYFSSHQPDKEIFRIFEKFNSIKKIDKGSVEIQLKEYNGIEEDIDQKPDIAPVLSSVLAFANTKSILKNVLRLKDKESNRLEEIIKMLECVGVETKLEEDNLIIFPLNKKVKKELIYSGKDHRMAMAYCSLLLGLEEDSTLIIKHPECVEKSYKNYFEDLISLGYIVEKI